MKKHLKIKSRNPIAKRLQTKQFHSKIIKQNKKSLLQKVFDKMKYDIEQ